MNRRPLWALLAIAAAFALVGCSGSGGSSDQSRIRGQYSQLARATEREDIGGVMTLFSPNYLDGGYDYVDMRNLYAERFDGWENIDCSYIINDVRVNGNFATASIIEVLDLNNVFRPGAPREHYETPLTDIWRYENGDWYLYGDQQNTAALTRKSMRFSPKGQIKQAPTQK